MPNKLASSWNRRSFIGGSDARIIMGADETALVRLWRETVSYTHLTLPTTPYV